jgi:hypothetical protein
MHRQAALLALASLLFACPKHIDARPASARAVRLLADTPERETTAIPDQRPDIEFEHSDFQQGTRVVATGETPLLNADGADVRLYGDEAGTQGWSVDNGILLEVLGSDGKLLNRAFVGFANGLVIGSEHIDSLSRRAFAFDAGEVTLAPLLPERGPFRVRATVLDSGGVGRVTDVWLLVKPRAAEKEELRD